MSGGTGCWLPPQNILSGHFEKKKIFMVLSWNLQNMLETPFPSFISKKTGEIPIFGPFFWRKFNFALYFPENRPFHVGHVWKRYCDGIRCPIFKILVSMERGDHPLYYGTTHSYFGHVNLKFMRGVATRKKIMVKRTQAKEVKCAKNKCWVHKKPPGHLSVRQFLYQIVRQNLRSQ